jgi:hypothetical protein
MKFSTRLSLIISWLMFIAAIILFCTSCSHTKLVPGNYYNRHHFHKKAPKVIADSTSKLPTTNHKQ